MRPPIDRLRGYLWKAACRHLTPDEVRALNADDIRGISGLGPISAPPLIDALYEVQFWTDGQIKDWIDPYAVIYRQREEHLAALMQSGMLTQETLAVITNHDRQAAALWLRGVEGQTHRAIGEALGVSRSRAHQLYLTGLRTLRRRAGRNLSLRRTLATTSTSLYADVFGEPPSSEEA